jgi:hypothetical protein
MKSCIFTLNKAILIALMLSSPLFAAPVLHMLFHMGMGANGEFFVGGTLKNKGDQDIYQGFVVITPLTKECYPKQPLLSPFKVIKAGQKQEFRIPVKEHLYGYKIDTVHAVDSFANQVTVVDETAEILARKQENYIARCTQLRAAQH